MSDGYYFTVAERTTTDKNGVGSTEGFDAVLYYKNFKAGGKNDNETPDDNVTIFVIYPQGSTPPDQDPVPLNDGQRNNSKFILP
jgi:hypothetical protein